MSWETKKKKSQKNSLEQNICEPKCYFYYILLLALTGLQVMIKFPKICWVLGEEKS